MNAADKYENKLFETTNCGNLIITKYSNAKEFHVRFINTGYETVARIGNIKTGRVKDKSIPSVYDIGVVGDEPAKINGKTLKEYEIWVGVLERCYDHKLHLKYPRYLGCTTSNNFKYYPYFKDWCSKQIGFDQEGWHLDKDILVKGNKCYSEDTCCFVPREINNLFVKNDSKRGKYAVGVTYHKLAKKFVTQLRKHGKNEHLGVFNTELEAFLAYKQAKEVYIKELANKWKDKIDLRVYDALMSWVIEITD